MRHRFSLRITCVLSILALGLNSCLLGRQRHPALPRRVGCSIYKHGGDRISLSCKLLQLFGLWSRCSSCYMDVTPKGQPNGRTVIFHHGLYYGWYWENQIEALSSQVAVSWQRIGSGGVNLQANYPMQYKLVSF